jgi:hypothetical protein
MDRYTFCERALRQIYGEQPTDDSNITVNLVNSWLGDATAFAAKKNWTDNVQIDQLAYVNNGFYTTFKGIAVIDTGEQFLYQLTLPEIPIGIGRNEAISTLQFVDQNGFVSDPAIPLSQAQVGYFRGQRPIPNKIMYYPEGTFLYAISTLQLFTPNYTGKVKMVSAGDSTNLDSILNVPQDYFPQIVEYIKMQLSFERAQPKDLQNDGQDS